MIEVVPAPRQRVPPLQPKAPTLLLVFMLIMLSTPMGAKVPPLLRKTLPFGISFFFVVVIFLFPPSSLFLSF